ncbi:hypothetical protein GJAV_G00269000 [Gymnothorax javanicus]|nr:hypothetical protein GJAV_G00269000 [Gymnothorax javanicus]
MHGPRPKREGLRAQKSAGMRQHLPGMCLLLLWLPAGAGALQVLSRSAKCPQPKALDTSSCQFLSKWNSLVRNVDENITTSDDESILKGMTKLETIAATPEYGCVLKQIYQFYNTVLAVAQRRWGKFEDLWHSLGRLKECHLRVHCPRLCRRIIRDVKRKGSDAFNTSELAKFQIQKLLWEETGVAKNVTILEKAIVELKSLQFYPSNKMVKKGKCSRKRARPTCSTS